MRIIFMGTPDFAVPTLKALIKSSHEVVAVFTQPDKAVGRKQILTPPPVKVAAKEAEIPVYQPISLKNDDIVNCIKEFNPDVIVVVAYGKILPEAILSIPKYGCINGHASLLPRHRGASPIQWSIVCGDKTTGVTTMLMEKGLDTGDMLLKEEVVIGDNETGEELHDKLSEITSSLMLNTLLGVEKGDIIPQKQDDSFSTYAPIITREMGYIDFSKSANEIHNLIRGFYSWPAAYFYLDGKRIKVLAAKLSGKTNEPFGTIIDSDNELIVACCDGNSISLIEIQAEGSKRMLAKDYLKGHSIEKGTVITRE
ncbi:MAG: methionyl-tRNA formyltransferase [Clostridia bacterium]|nr:methionyl-tRNA formyltransferase [Clostridia bacterium]